MAHQMVQEGVLWSSVTITLGLCWHKVKLILSMVVVVLSDVGSTRKMHINSNVIHCD